jgi:hypothetical protein
MTVRRLSYLWLSLVLLVGCSDAFRADKAVQGPSVGNDVHGVIDGLLGDSVSLDISSSDLPLDVSPVGGCGAGCPSGYVCYGAGPEAKCLPGPDFACAPCVNSGTCLGGLCMGFPDRKGCLIPCVGSGKTSSCPNGFTCDTGLCYPVSKSCTCGPGNDGQARGCTSGNGSLGVCGGAQTCDAASGWSVCTAQAPTAETCDGLDDDCDGQTDEGLGGTPCGTGSCAGKSVCMGGKEACDGPAAVTEVCNGLDDDCDGERDEDFGSWHDNCSENKYGKQYFIYNKVNNCGGCGIKCQAPANGTASCELNVEGGASCAWWAECKYGCIPGYYKDIYGCHPLVDVACQPCDATTAGNCSNAKVGLGLVAAPCGPNLPCSSGFLCDPQEGVCLPASGDCTCTLAQAGLQKPCQNGTCAGTSTCDPAKGWSACTAPAPTAETCNALDDDCNGATDDLPGVGSPCAIANDAGQCLGKQACSPKGLTCVAQIPSVETCNGLDDDCDGTTDDDVGAGLPCGSTNTFGTCTGVVVCSGAKGLSCNAKVPGAEVCDGLDDDCNGVTDDDWLDSTGIYSTPAACGSCQGVCAKPLGANAIPTCMGSTCSLACESGWVDMDANLGNGCECLFVSDFDEPDGVDQNCDGIDGDISKAVFVAKTGADGNPGTRELPVASIQKALGIAELASKRDVYVAGGVYTGSVDLIAGVSLYGGYGPGFAERDTVSHQTAIVGIAPTSGPSVAVRCTGISGVGQTTRVDGLTILSANAKAAGESSYGLLSDGCDDRLQVTYLQIGAGDGAAGSAGLPGQNGPKGVLGSSGIKAKDIGHDLCAPTDASPGGPGGLQECGGSDASGGHGGTTVCPSFDEDNPTPMCPSFPYLQSVQQVEIGSKGAGPGGGGGGVPGADAYIDSYKGKVTQCQGNSSCNTCHVPVKQLYGDDGEHGATGTMGEAGPGCKSLQGKVIDGKWVPIAGGDGGLGLSGGGGGGCGGPSVWIVVSGAPAGTAALLQKQNQGKSLGLGGKGGSGGPSIGLPGLAGSSGLAAAVLDL